MLRERRVDFQTSSVHPLVVVAKGAFSAALEGTLGPTEIAAAEHTQRPLARLDKSLGELDERRRRAERVRHLRV